MKPKLLLHTCCATCSGFLVRRLSADYEVTVFYANDNIFPEEEFLKRRHEAENFFRRENITFIACDYNHQNWLSAIAGHENEPERGLRCRLCYRYRLTQVAKAAQTGRFDFFASTLAISPHKDASVINNLGTQLAEEYGVDFLAGDWKKADGFKQAMDLSRQENFYRQNYCGCEFSR